MSGEKLRKILAGDLAVKVASLLLAVVIWFAVTDVKSNISQVVERCFSVPLRVVGVPPELVAVSPEQDVELRLKGPRNAVDGAAGKLAAEVNLSARGEGVHVLKVATVFPERVELVEVVPSSVQVRLEAMVSRVVDLSVAVVGPPGHPAPSYLPQASAHMVSVRGPRSRVGRVVSAVCAVSLDPGTGLVREQETSPVPVDADGSPVPGLTVSPAPVAVGSELTRNPSRE